MTRSVTSTSAEEAGHPTRVAWWWTGRVARCDLVEPGRGDVRRRSVPYRSPGRDPRRPPARLGRAAPDAVRRPARRHQRGSARRSRCSGSARWSAPSSDGCSRRSTSTGCPTSDAPDVVEVPRPRPLPRPAVRRGCPTLLDQLLGWVPDVELGLGEVRDRLPGRGLRRRPGGTPPPTRDRTRAGPGRRRTAPSEDRRPGPARRQASSRSATQRPGSSPSSATQGATTAAICRAAGVGSGTLFHYFGDKRSLMVAIFADDQVVNDERARLPRGGPSRSTRPGGCSTTCAATSADPARARTGGRDAPARRGRRGVRRAAGGR